MDVMLDEVMIWCVGVCLIWNEFILSGFEVNWRRVADEYGDFASLIKDWFYFKKLVDVVFGVLWFVKMFGVDNDSV